LGGEPWTGFSPIPVQGSLPKVTFKTMKEKKEKADNKAKAEFRALIENYKKQSPVKYELRKAELQAKLDAIK